ncbi:MAG: hypothetical protein GF372_03915 [Candidatus Marinimicrobia bacterium]|nr:hypothetical protein [Candidatus Neomarinimicrobiota bacterium]
MKRCLYVLILIAFNSNVSGQYVIQTNELSGKFGLSVGTALPQDNLAEMRGVQAGGAQTGLYFGLEYVLPFKNNEYFSWQTDIRLITNETRLPEGFSNVGITGNESNWFHIIPTLGLRFSPVSTKDFELFAVAQFGFAYIITPQIDSDVLLPGSAFTYKYQRSTYGFTYALSPAIGMKIFRNFELNAEYIYGGTVNYEAQVQGLNNSLLQQDVEFKTPLKFLNIWANYHVYF